MRAPKRLAALTFSNEKRISVLPVLQRKLLKKQRANFFCRTGRTLIFLSLESVRAANCFSNIIHIFLVFFTKEFKKLTFELLTTHFWKSSNKALISDFTFYFQMHPRISIRGYVRPSIRRLVRQHFFFQNMKI